MANTIRLFMWGYQHYFRAHLLFRAKGVLRALGVADEAKALLVGACRPGGPRIHPVCVEPEDGPGAIEPFDGLLGNIEQKFANHKMQRMFYGDSVSMEQKPENIRRDATCQAVAQALNSYDHAHAVQSFCGLATRVGDYYVVPVIQLPVSLLERFGAIALTSIFQRDDVPVNHSLILSAVRELLDEASDALSGPDPGRSGWGRDRPAADVARAAASRFMSAVTASINAEYEGADLFARLNAISSLMYEGAHGEGLLILTGPDDGKVRFSLRFKQPVPFSEHRWVRKVLEMARGGASLIADTNRIYGLGSVNEVVDQRRSGTFTVDFLDHYHWELRRDGRSLIACRYGEPHVPQDLVPKDLFVDNFKRLFPRCLSDDIDRIWALVIASTRQRHGCMIVVATDAAYETERLVRQGTPIEPIALDSTLLASVSGIDGSIIVAPDGTCHAIGVILDGPAIPDCMPSRGSRFNSGIRYVRAAPTGEQRLAIVVSDDRTIDVIPELRASVSRTVIEDAIRALEEGTVDNYHASRGWIDDHRFYLDDDQCARANAALENMETLCKDAGRMVIRTTRLRPHDGLRAIYIDP